MTEPTLICDTKYVYPADGVWEIKGEKIWRLRRGAIADRVLHFFNTPEMVVEFEGAPELSLSE